MTNIWKRSLSMFLAIVMVVGMLPVNAFAMDIEEEPLISEEEIVVSDDIVVDDTVTGEDTAVEDEPLIEEEELLPEEEETEDVPATTEAEEVVETTEAVEDEVVEMEITVEEGSASVDAMNASAAEAGYYWDETATNPYILHVGAGEAGAVTKEQLYDLLDEKWDTEKTSTKVFGKTFGYGGFKYGDVAIEDDTDTSSAGLVAGTVYNVYNCVGYDSGWLYVNSKWSSEPIATFKVEEAVAQDTITLKDAKDDGIYDVSVNTVTYSDLRDGIINGVIASINDGEVAISSAVISFKYVEEPALSNGWNGVERETVLTSDTLADYIASTNKTWIKISYESAEAHVVTINPVDNRLNAPSYTATAETKNGAAGIKSAAATAASALGLTAEDFSDPTGWEMTDEEAGSTTDVVLTATYGGGEVYKAGTVTVTVTVTKSADVPSVLNISESEDGGDYTVTYTADGSTVNVDSVNEAEVAITVTPASGNGYAYYLKSITVDGTAVAVTDNVAKINVANEQNTKTYNVVITYGKNELTVVGDCIVEANGYHTTTDYSARATNLKENILAEVLGSGVVGKEDNYTVEIWMDIHLGSAQYVTVGSTAFNLNLDRIYINASTKVRITDNTTGVVLSDVALTINESRTPAEMSAENVTLNVNAIDDAAVVTAIKNAVTAPEGATLALSKETGFVKGENKVTVTVTNDGETFVANTTGVEMTVTINVNVYTITFVNEDGTELQSSDWAYGATPSYTGATPTKAADAEFTYTFDKWSPEIAAVTGEATYTATYTSKINTYTISWDTDGDGNVDVETTADYGTNPLNAADAPTHKDKTAEDKSPNGWSNSGNVDENGNITGAVTYTAQYSNDTVYTVVFDIDGAKETQYINVTKSEKVTFPADPDKENAIFTGWTNTDQIVDGVPSSNVTLVATWNTNDSNDNNVDDDSETGYIQLNITNPNYGTVTINGEAVEAGKHEILFDSQNGDSTTVTIAATAAATEATNVEYYVVSADSAATVKNGETATVNVEFGKQEITILKTGDVFINGSLSNAGDKLSGLKDKVLTAAFGAGNYEAADYVVYMVTGSGNYDVETTNVLNQATMALRFNIGDTQSFIIEKKGSGIVPAVSDTISMTVKDSRLVLSISVEDVTISEKTKPADVLDQVKAKISIVATDPQTGSETTVAVSDSYLSWNPTYAWPEDGQTETFAVTVRVNTIANATYSNAPSAKLTLTCKDTTAVFKVIYTDGVEDAEVFADQTIVYTEDDTEVPAFEGEYDVREYYDFVAWEDTADEANNTITRTATWKPELDNNQNDVADQEETYTIVYDFDGGVDADGNTGKVYENLAWDAVIADVAAAPTVTKDNFYFDVWTPAVAQKVAAPAEGNIITYKATWNEKCVVTFVYDNGSENTIVNVEVNTVIPAEEIPADPEKKQAIFQGWFAEGEEKAFDFSLPITDSVTLTAKWLSDRNENGIEDGTAGDPYKYYIWTDGTNELNKLDWLAGEAEITAASFTYEEVANDGKVFASWSESTSGDTVTYTAVLVDDINNNEVADSQETVVITVTKAVDTDAVKIEGADQIDDTNNYVYDSTTVKSLAITATPTKEDRISKSFVSSITNDGVAAKLTYSNYAATATIPVANTASTVAENFQTIEVKFETAGFVYNDERLMNYYDGMENVKNDEVYDNIVKTPERTDDCVYTIRYKARKAMSQTVQLSSLGLNDTVLGILSTIGIQDFTFDMPDLWLDVNVETEGKVKDSVSLDQAVAQYLTTEKINGLWETYKSAAEANGGLIFGVSAGYEAVKGEIDAIYNNVYNAAMYYGAHNFGYNATGSETITEEIKITYQNDTMYIEGESDITLKDLRAISFIEAANVSVMYRDYTDEELISLIGAYVTDENGAKIEGAEAVCQDITAPYSFEGKYVSDTAYALTFKFGGNETYKPSEKVVMVTVTKATITAFDAPNKIVTYGETYHLHPAMTLGNKYGEEQEVIDSLVQFVIGLDVAELDVNADGVTGLDTRVQLILPAELQSMLDGLLGLTGGDTSDGMVMSLNELMEYLGTLPDTSLDSLNQALKAIEGIIETTDIEIIIGGDLPKDTGAYLHGAVTTSSNYETKFDVGYLVIKPDASRVYLDWNFSDTNGIFTPELLQHVNLGASAYDDAAFGTLNSVASSQINNLFFGIDANGELVALLFNKDVNDPEEIERTLDNGAYTQMAFIAEFGNEMYYAVPIVRVFTIMPNIVDVTIVDNEGTNFVRTFDNEEQKLDVELKYTGSAITPSEDNLTVTYTGIQTNTQTYEPTETAPMHAGVYLVSAFYKETDANGKIVAIGTDVKTLTIMPAETTTDVKDEVIITVGDNFDVMKDMITVTTDSGVTSPDMTIISAQIATNGTFSDNGWSAIGANMNVDFPDWMDELMAEHVPSVKDGITAAEFIKLVESKLPAINAKLEEAGASNEIINSFNNLIGNVTDALAQVPENVTLTFKDIDEHTFANVGAYVISAIVTDSDHIPSADIGILIVKPDVTEVELKWNHEDENNIWTRELLVHADLWAKAFNKETGALDSNATAKITYQFIGFDKEGNFIVKDTDDVAELPNGVYTELAYIELMLDGKMVISDLIARTIAIVPGTAVVEFIDQNGNVNPDQKFIFDNTNKEMIARVTINGAVINEEAVDGKLTVKYAGIQTNGKTYEISETAPTHAGVYTVVAEYRDNTTGGSVAHIGGALGIMAIEPAESSIAVTGDTVTYDGKEHTATVEVTIDEAINVTTPDYTLISGGAYVTGDIDNVGVDAFHGTVNIDFPEWLDAKLADTEAFKENVTPAYLIDFISSYRDDLVSMIPVEELVAAGVAEAEINDAIEELNAYIDELLTVLEKLPEDVKLSFEDDVAYTEPGVYLYYGIVTDSDFYPSTDTGLLVIEKKDMKFGAWHEVVPYDGEEHTIFVPNDFISVEDAPTVDYLTMIVHRETNNVNFILDADAMYAIDTVERILNIEIPDEISIADLRAKLAENGLDVDDFAEAVIQVLDAIMADMEVPADPEEYAKSTHHDLIRIKEVLNALPETGTITINGSKPVDVGVYEFYIVAYAQYYKTQNASAMLFIEPIRVVVDDIENSKVYGETDPELTANVRYYSIQGREDPYTYEGKTDGKYAEKYNIATDETYSHIVYSEVAVTKLPDDIALSYDVTRAAGEDVGLYDMQVENAAIIDSKNYVLEVIEDDSKFEIMPTLVTITVDDKTKVYGEDDPELTYSVDGLANDDLEDALNIVVSRESGENVGTYVITATASNDNYDFKIVEGTLEITKKSISVAANNAEKRYGTTDPAFSGTIDGLVDGDTLYVTYTRESGENVGNYAITPNVDAENNSAVMENYEIAYINGTLKITEKSINAEEITIELADSLRYNGNRQYQKVIVKDGEKELVEGKDYVLSNNANANAGDYTLTIQGMGNYNNTDSVAWSIAKAEVTVAVQDDAITYGETYASSTDADKYTVSGLFGDDKLNVTTKLVDTFVAANAGTHEAVITATVEDNSNYTVKEIIPGDLTIHKAKVTITVADAELIYGKEYAQTEDPKVEGLVNGETMDVTTKLDEGIGKNVGTYTDAIIAVYDENTNYDVTVNKGDLVIKKAIVTVTLKDAEMTVDGTVPELEYETACDGVVTEEELDLEIKWNDPEKKGDYFVPGEYTQYTATYHDPENTDATETTEATYDNWDVIIEEDAKLTVTIGDYVCWNMQTGVYYDDLSEALKDADDDAIETVQMLKGFTETDDLIIYPGTTLDLADHTVVAESHVIGIAGSFLHGDLYSDAEGAVYGKLITMKTFNMLINDYPVEGSYVDEKGYNILPVYVGTGYVFSRFDSNTNRATVAKRGLTIDENNKSIYFQFVTNTTGAVRTDYLTNGIADNKLSIIIRLEWENEKGIAYQDFVYNEDFVKAIFGTRDYDFNFTLNGYDKLGIDVNTLTVKAMTIADCGATEYGVNWTK